MERRDRIKQAFLHGWKGYKQYAWGYDEFLPLSKTGRNLAGDAGPVGFTIVDALDTMLIMNLKAQYQEARSLVENLSFDIDGTVSLFELTIRVRLGVSNETNSVLRDDFINVFLYLIVCYETTWRNIPMWPHILHVVILLHSGTLVSPFLLIHTIT